MIKAKRNLDENQGELALGILLTDQLLFSLMFQQDDLSLEPTVEQKLMICDESQYVLLCTSRHVAKTVTLKGRIAKDAVTYLPEEGARNDEILVFTPSESHLTPLVGRIFDFLSRNPLFRATIKTWNRTTDKPLLETKSGLKINFRIEGANGTDTNMVGLHPFKIYGDECAFGNEVCHTSRMAGAQPNARIVYAGVPNGVRSTPFYRLDKTKYGDDWSRHKFSMLTANPMFLKSKKYAKKITAMFGGKHSPAYLTQVRGEWGDEAMSSFPPGSISFDTIIYGRKVLPYYDVRLSAIEVNKAAKEGRLPLLLKIPSVSCLRAAIGWDYGFSPDPTNFIVAIQTDEDGPWKTYCRVSLYSTPKHRQVDVLKILCQNVLNNKVMLISTDNNDCIQELYREENIHIFQNRAKLSNPGGTVEIDTITGKIVLESDDKNLDVIRHREDGKVVKEGRKYWMTELLRRYMMSAILKNPNEVRLELGYDGEMESEFIGTVERKTEKKTVYDVPRNAQKVPQDQTVDALRYLVDAICDIEGMRHSDEPVDYTSSLQAFGWTGKKNTNWRPAWA